MLIHLARAFLALLLLACPSWAQDLRLFRIGTGGLLGVYYPIGKAMAEGFTVADIAPGLIAVAQTSGGSIDNVRALLDGEIEAGLAQADVALWAQTGQGPFAGDQRGQRLRAVAGLYPERLQIVTRKDAGIRNVRDFRGKTISLDEDGSGTLAVMRIVLEAHGLGEKDFNPVYLKPEFTVEQLLGGKLQGFCLVAGTPTNAIGEIMDHELLLVPISLEAAEKIKQQHPYLVPGVIPAGTYPGLQETSTIEVHALLLVHEDMDEDLVYRMTEALWSEQTRSLLHNAHLLGQSILPERALHGLSVPLHRGAQRFYVERGLISREELTP